MYDLPMHLGRDSSGRTFHLYDVPISALQEVPNAHHCEIESTVTKEPGQVATLTQLQVQDEELTDTDSLEVVRNDKQHCEGVGTSTV